MVSPNAVQGILISSSSLAPPARQEHPILLRSVSPRSSVSWCLAHITLVTLITHYGLVTRDTLQWTRAQSLSPS